MPNLQKLTSLAETFRRLRFRISDPTTVEALTDLATKYERQAIRVRAYNIWQEEGKPEGRHLDNWVQAERELLRRAGSKRTQ